ncbi:MAG: hypothetical protein ABJZ55_03035 [Fuerstiella sp.]
MDESNSSEPTIVPREGTSSTTSFSPHIEYLTLSNQLHYHEQQLHSAEDLKTLEGIHPGYIAHLIEEQKAEAKHRRAQEKSMMKIHEQESKATWEDRERSVKTAGGLVGLLGVASLATSAFIAWMGHPISAGFVGAIPVVGIAAAFLKQQNEESGPRIADSSSGQDENATSDRTTKAD